MDMDGLPDESVAVEEISNMGVGLGSATVTVLITEIVEG
jgi:hypothetical protein